MRNKFQLEGERAASYLTRSVTVLVRTRAPAAIHKRVTPPVID
jgi:hypothetical protein